LTSIACVILTVALILMAHTNQKWQVKLQSQQQVLNQGILGQQAQQISAGILQELAATAVTNVAIRELLEKYGYRLSASQPRDSAIDLPVKKQKKSTNTEASK
jgi:negative regulator of sigma E activity